MFLGFSRTIGTEIIPGPVEEFHSNLVTDSSVGVSWIAPKNYNISNYQVFYQLRSPSSATSSVDKPEEVKSVSGKTNMRMSI